MTLVTIFIVLLVAAFALYILRQLLPKVGVPPDLVNIVLLIIAFIILIWLLSSIGLLPNFLK